MSIGRSWQTWQTRRVRGALIAVAILGLAACNDVGDCPDPSAIVPGASCSGDSLSCPYVLQSLDPSCDGTMADGGIQTACVCTHGSWSCPQPVSCDGAAPAGDDDGGGSSQAGEDGPGE